MTFFDPPERELQPRENVRIEQIEIYPYPDRFRVFIHIVVTPFEDLDAAEEFYMEVVARRR